VQLLRICFKSKDIKKQKEQSETTFRGWLQTINVKDIFRPGTMFGKRQQLRAGSI
jgi:hypothetical protein